MANILLNRISKSLTEAEMQEFRNLIQRMNDLLSFSVGLTVDERIRLPKIDSSNKLFVQDSLRIMKQNPMLIPAFVNTEEVEKDFVLYQQLDELYSMVAQIDEKISDTRMLAGSEAYSSSLMAYRMFQMAAEAGMPGMESAVDELKKRFAGQGGNSSSENTEENK